MNENVYCPLGGSALLVKA